MIVDRPRRLVDLPVAGFILGAASAAAAILYLGRHLGFFSDELDWLTLGDDFSPRTILTPHNGQLIGGVRTVYELLPSVFGSSYLPFRVVAIAALIGCAALFFVLARRRLGSAAALLPALLLLCFGSAASIMLSALALPFTLSIGFGLAALVAVERNARLSDAVTAALLLLSIFSDTFGVIFALGVAVFLLRQVDPRRLWIVVGPLALYALWWLWAQQFDQALASASNAARVPGFIIEAAAAALAAVAGIGHVGFGADASTSARVLGAAFAVLVFVLVAAMAMRVRRGEATPWLWAYATMLTAFWVGIGLSEDAARTPETPRYLYFGAVMILLMGAELLREKPLKGPLALGLATLLGFSVLVNSARLVRSADDLTEEANVVGTQVTMIEIAGHRGDEAFAPRQVAPRGSEQVTVPAARLVAFAEETGPLGLTLDEVRDQSETVRADGDFVLAASLGLMTVPAEDGTTEELGCRRFAAGATIPLANGLSSFRPRAGTEPAVLELGRFGDEATVPVGELQPGVEAVLSLPSDSAMDPWLAEVAVPTRLCSPRDIVASG